MRIEMLYPEVANLHGDNFNITYLSQCRPDIEIIRTRLTEVPAFATGDVDLVYLGPMAEEHQRLVTDRLRPYADRIAELIEQGTSFLFTHNAVEVLGHTIHNGHTSYDGLGVFPLTTTIRIGQRYNGKVMGPVPTSNGEITVVGYKSQFSMVDAPEDLPGFLVADHGIGRNRHTRVEGIRRNNFIGTSLLGPILITNPLLTKDLLARLDPGREPVLAFGDLALTAYSARLEDFRQPVFWKPREIVTPARVDEQV